MVLFKETKFDPACKQATMYAGQLGLQKLLVFVALICVPWMLLAKPIIIMREKKKMNYQVRTEPDASKPDAKDTQISRKFSS